MTLSNTQTLRNAYQRYLCSTDRTLRDCYKTWSDEKENAFQYCLSIMAEKNGYEPRIVSHSIFCFSFGFMFDENGRQNFAYITKNADRYCYL